MPLNFNFKMAHFELGKFHFNWKKCNSNNNSNANLRLTEIVCVKHLALCLAQSKHSISAGFNNSCHHLSEKEGEIVSKATL